MPNNFVKILDDTNNNSIHSLIKHKNITKRLSSLILLLFIAGITLLIWVSVVEPNSLILNKQVVKLSYWNKNHNGFKIILISDIHAGSPFIDQDKLDQVVKLSNDQKPDLVLLLGDYVIQGVINGRFIKPAIISKKLSKLKAKYGVYAVLGNHDVWYNAAEVKQSLLDNGIEVLDNSSKKLIINDKTLWVSGVEDLTTQNADYEKVLSEIKDDSTILLLSHDPDIFPLLPNRNLFMLSGHSHGGQIKFPYGKSIFGNSRYGVKYSAGFFSEGAKTLFVSTGIGTSILPIRFGIPPEIVSLEIYKGS